jgi:hypothetical protein
MATTNPLALETILRQCADNSPSPWYPSAYAKSIGVQRDSLDEPLNQLRLKGLIKMTNWVKGKGQGYLPTEEGQHLLQNPRDLEGLQSRQLSGRTIDPAAQPPIKVASVPELRDIVAAPPTYKSIAFIADESDFTLSAISTRLRSMPSHPKLSTKLIGESGLQISFGGWRLQIVVVEGGYVPAEAKELAKANPKYRHAKQVAKCRRMASIWSTDPDPQMDHFNDYLLTVEIIAAFRGVYAQDDTSGKWFDGPK